MLKSKRLVKILSFVVAIAALSSINAHAVGNETEIIAEDLVDVMALPPGADGPNVIIGSDERVLVTNVLENPFRMIVRLEAFVNNNGNMIPCEPGTGFLIDEDTIMTAAHVVRGNPITSAADRVNIYFGRNGNSYSAMRTSTDIEIHEFYTGSTNSFDIAIINLSAPVAGFTGHFDINYFGTGDNLNGQNVYIAGYPNAGSDFANEYGTNKMAVGYGQLTESNYFQLKYRIDTEGGQSGSPVYYYNTSTGRYTVCGVHVTSGSTINIATTINDEVRSLYDPNLS